MGRVSGKVCIVTGGASGIGKASAAALVREGAHVVFGDRNAELGHAAAAEIGGGALFVPHDVAAEDEWRSLVAMVTERFGRLDVLVNNAGISRASGIEDETLEHWRAVQAVNVEGPFLGCKHAIPLMHRSGGGSIVNITSSTVHQPLSANIAYAVSKGALETLTRSVAVYCMERDYGIRCNAVGPHAADTPLLQSTLNTLFANMPPGSRENMKLKLGSPVAVANAVLFLASDESSDLTGTALTLDRGARLILAQGLH